MRCARKFAARAIARYSMLKGSSIKTLARTLAITAMVLACLGGKLCAEGEGSEAEIYKIDERVFKEI